MNSSPISRTGYIIISMIIVQHSTICYLLFYQTSTTQLHRVMKSPPDLQNRFLALLLHLHDCQRVRPDCSAGNAGWKIYIPHRMTCSMAAPGRPFAVGSGECLAAYDGTQGARIVPARLHASCFMRMQAILQRCDWLRLSHTRLLCPQAA